MKAFKIDDRQQKMIEAFFKDELSRDQNAPLLKYVCCLFVGISMFLILVPFLTWENDGTYLSVFGFIIFAGGLSINTSKYKTRAVSDTNRYIRFSAVLQYLPVDMLQLVIFRIRKSIKPCVICMSISIVFRCLVSYGAYGIISVWDIVLPLIAMIITPIINGI